jgi:hypothetical protein
MHKSALFIILTISSIIFTLGSMPEPRNPPLGNTGAPGESACMLSGCHSGGTYNGSVSLMGLPDTVEADKTYDFSLVNQSNAVRSGFQLTALDTSLNSAGTLIKTTGVNIAKNQGNGRSYARQEFAINFANGQASWNLQWKAPNSISGDEIIFYFASMCANGDGDKGKDNSLKNSKRVFFKLPVSTKDHKNVSPNLRLYYSANQLFIKDKPQQNLDHLAISTLNGIQVYKLKSTSSNVIALPDGLSGVYIVNYSLGKTSYSEKIWIP